MPRIWPASLTTPDEPASLGRCRGEVPRHGARHRPSGRTDGSQPRLTPRVWCFWECRFRKRGRMCSGSWTSAGTNSCAPSLSIWRVESMNGFCRPISRKAGGTYDWTAPPTGGKSGCTSHPGASHYPSSEDPEALQVAVQLNDEATREPDHGHGHQHTHYTAHVVAQGHAQNHNPGGQLEASSYRRWVDHEVIQYVDGTQGDDDDPPRRGGGAHQGQGHRWETSCQRAQERHDVGEPRERA